MNGIMNAIQKFFDGQPIVKFGLLLGLALVISASMLSGAIIHRDSDESISVTGAASKTIQSDHAVWQIKFARQGKDLKGTYASMAKDLGLVKAYLQKQGVDEKAFNIAPVNTTTLYVKNSQGYDSNTVDAYKLEQTVRIESDDPKKLELLSQQAIDLINQGVVLDSQAPEFYFTKLDDLKIDMLGEATKNAVERGRKIAQSTSRDIGVLRSANVGVFQITAKNSTEVSDYGIYDTTSIEKKVTAVVNATFSVR